MPEQRARRRLIEAQSAAIARAMASICNDERSPFGVMSGHDRKTLSLSGPSRPLKQRLAQTVAHPSRFVAQPVGEGRPVRAGQPLMPLR